MRVPNSAHQEMAWNKLLDPASSFRSSEADVFLIVASSRYKPVNDRFIDSLSGSIFLDWSLRDFMVHLYKDSGGDLTVKNPASVARALAVEWNGKSFKDYHFWILQASKLKPAQLILDDRGGSTSREATVTEATDEELMVQKYTRQSFEQYMVPRITAGPSNLEYKIGLVGGNGPIAGAFAVLIVAEKLLEAGRGLGQVTFVRITY